MFGLHRYGMFLAPRFSVPRLPGNQYSPSFFSITSLMQWRLDAFLAKNRIDWSNWLSGPFWHLSLVCNGAVLQLHERSCGVQNCSVQHMRVYCVQLLSRKCKGTSWRHRSIWTPILLISQADFGRKLEKYMVNYWPLYLKDTQSQCCRRNLKYRHVMKGRHSFCRSRITS